ncbi:MAG: hypothetical protein BTN85_0855 [Candidatus Methanohalarchaeum thermophilum]|uniref:Uncharacterized protein n=1 Tax=Methanohalarchaeum thermophilum TaxID=1903181 RepID=A0A1Q6DVH6_METT1|nr:MAG: hypothetical protein BTN85_0855 [Candidatus Methanohalarchaeum thermophilum]
MEVCQIKVVDAGSIVELIKKSKKLGIGSFNVINCFIDSISSCWGDRFFAWSKISPFCDAFTFS